MTFRRKIYNAESRWKIEASCSRMDGSICAALLIPSKLELSTLINVHLNTSITVTVNLDWSMRALRVNENASASDVQPSRTQAIGWARSIKSNFYLICLHVRRCNEVKCWVKGNFRWPSAADHPTKIETFEAESFLFLMDSWVSGWIILDTCLMNSEPSISVLQPFY